MMELNQLRELQERWQPPPELARSRPRPVRFTPAGVALMALAVTLLVSAALLGAWLWLKAEADSERERLLAQESVTAEGKVRRLWQRRGDKQRACRVDFSFTAGGREYFRSAVIPCRAWGEFSEADRLTVQFVASRPEINRLAGLERPRQTPYWAAPLVAASLAVTAVLMARYLAGRRRLLAEGRPAPGIVTHLGRKSQYGREAGYEFPTLSGIRARGKFGPVKDKEAPSPGTVIVVVYDPDEPRSNARYPMSLVKVER